MLLPKFLSRKISPENSLDFLSQKSVLRQAILSTFEKNKRMFHSKVPRSKYSRQYRGALETNLEATVSGVKSESRVISSLFMYVYGGTLLHAIHINPDAHILFAPHPYMYILYLWVHIYLWVFSNLTVSVHRYIHM